MRCANCGAEVADGTVFCPHCGYRVKSRAPSAAAATGPEAAPPRGNAPAPQPAKTYPLPRTAAPEPELPAEEEEAARRPSGCRWLLLTGAFTLVFLVLILGLAALGAYHGLQDQNREKLQLAQTHYEKGLNYLSTGDYGLAIAEMEEALRLNPEFEGAKQKLAEAQALKQAVPTPTGSPVRQAVEELYRLARAAYNERDWEGSIAAIEELRAVDASYQQEEVQTLLFWSYYNSGLALVDEGRLEEAVRRFDEALKLQPKNPDVLGQRHLASLYIAGLSYWEADWGSAIEKFDSVYRIEPNYRDVRQRLHDARVRYGEVLASKEEWCAAAEQYAAALQIIPTDEISRRQKDAADRCTAAGGTTSAQAP